MASDTGIVHQYNIVQLNLSRAIQPPTTEAGTGRPTVILAFLCSIVGLTGHIKTPEECVSLRESRLLWSRLTSALCYRSGVLNARSTVERRRNYRLIALASPMTEATVQTLWQRSERRSCLLTLCFVLNKWGFELRT